MAIWRKREPQSVIDNRISYDAPLDSLRYVVLDTELTSLEHRSNRLLSIGAIAMQGASILLGEQFYRLVNPQVDIPAESIVIHQIRSQDVASADGLSQTLEELNQFVRGAVLVGHFTQIDLEVVRKEMAQTGRRLENPAIDTARVQHWLLRNGPLTEDLQLRLEKLDLGTVAKSYALDSEGAHHALADAFLTARLWQKMLASLHTKGVRELKQVLKLGGAK